MNWSKSFLVLCLLMAALMSLSDGFFLKKKLKKLLLAKALIKGPILALGAASAGKALKAKVALPAGVAVGAGATALLGSSSGSSSTARPAPSYYPSIAPAVSASDGYAYPAPAEPSAPASNYGTSSQGWGPSAPVAQSVQYFEQPQPVGHSSVSGDASQNYGPLGASLGHNNYQQPAW